MRIALGLDLHLDDFADEHQALTSRHWGGQDWRHELVEVARHPDTEIFWNLTEVNVEHGIQRAAANVGLHGNTDWELLQMKLHPEWLERCTWYRDGAQVPQPGILSPSTSEDGTLES